MAIKLVNISISNFKYIKSEEIVNLEIDDNLTILKGPNGYGKSTIFDSIELLITGDIKHFNSNLKNRGQIDKSVLANDPSKNVEVVGSFVDEIESDFKIRRVFKNSNGFKSEIYYNDDKIGEDKLFEILKINKKLFDMGSYISQSKSLDFLERKYKERKSDISGILDDSNLVERMEQLKIFEDGLKLKIQKEKEDNSKKKKNLEEEIDKLDKVIKSLKNLSHEVPYRRLFEDHTYEFDKELINIELPYESQIAIIEDLKELIRNYDKIIVSKNALRISKLLKMEKKNFVTYYYRNIIDTTKDKINFFKELIRVETLIENTDLENIEYLNKFLAINDEEQERIRNLIIKSKNLKNQITNNEKIIKEILDKRNELNQKYLIAIDEKILEKNNCPLCGRPTENLERLFIDTTNVLKLNSSIVLEQINNNDQLIKIYFEDILRNKLFQIKQKNQVDLDNYEILKEYYNLDVSNIKDEEEFMLGFQYQKNTLKDLHEFEDKYSKLLSELMEKIRTLGEVLSPEKIKKYDIISEKYYRGQKPKHKVEELDDKISFIAFAYENNIFNKLKRLKDEQKKLEEVIGKSEKLMDNKLMLISRFRLRFNNAYKEYQSKIVKKIRIPMYIYCGKIVQTYPLGLGINVDIDDNQIVFTTENKNEDIFNYLSLGQLNGVVLSILLSVKKLYTNNEGINFILIDDPLQSIDDISSFSFADLLAEEFHNCQIVVSTHEDDKANLFRFKFKQHNKDVKEYNMHDKYLGV